MARMISDNSYLRAWKPKRSETLHTHVQHGKLAQRVQYRSHRQRRSSWMRRVLGQKVRSTRHNAIRYDGQLVTRFKVWRDDRVTSWLVPSRCRVVCPVVRRFLDQPLYFWPLSPVLDIVTKSVGLTSSIPLNNVQISCAISPVDCASTLISSEVNSNWIGVVITVRVCNEMHCTVISKAYPTSSH